MSEEMQLIENLINDLGDKIYNIDSESSDWAMKYYLKLSKDKQLLQNVLKELNNINQE